MKPKVLVIVGPTASGKTSLSIQLAKRFNGEVVSADSRQVYTGLDLGTGKVTKEEMDEVPHHLLDIADPKDAYNASQYVEAGKAALEGILFRNRLPIITGGTFFYIDALLGKFTLPDTPPNPLLRETLEGKTTQALFELLKEKDARYSEIVDRENPRRLIRAIEIIEALGHMPEHSQELSYNTLTLGIEVPKEILKEKIHTRLLLRLEQGMVKEVQDLMDSGLPYERLQDLGLEYRFISQYLRSAITYEEMLSQIETKTWQYAKRQMTWLKRDENIVWVDPHDIESIVSLVREFLK
jgi:tRNA dimethylallyltransferase